MERALQPAPIANSIHTKSRYLAIPAISPQWNQGNARFRKLASHDFMIIILWLDNLLHRRLL
ncbi:MAG TPA: hypothetical protein VEL31_20185, partial [Ktedonobacteraceae bacterium]|nr:hypothetical protein [Ktedonobacteraceae bacterium]